MFFGTITYNNINIRKLSYTLSSEINNTLFIGHPKPVTLIFNGHHERRYSYLRKKEVISYLGRKKRKTYKLTFWLVNTCITIAAQSTRSGCNCETLTLKYCSMVLFCWESCGSWEDTWMNLSFYMFAYSASIVYYQREFSVNVTKTETSFETIFVHLLCL